MGLFETLEWIRRNDVVPIRDYGPQARYQDHSLRKHNGPATPGRINIQYVLGDHTYVLDAHVRDHDITEDQFGNIQYIQLLHDDNHVQIVRSTTFVVEFWAD